MGSNSILDSIAVLNSELDLDILLAKVLDISLDLTGAERALLMLREGADLAPRAARSRHQDLNVQEFRASSTVIQKVLKERQAYYVPAVSDEKELVDKESVKSLSLKSALCVPLRSSRLANANEDIIGLIYLDSAALIHPLGQEHLQLMQSLANHVAISIENARMFLELASKNSEIAGLNAQLQQAVEIQAGNIADMRSLLQQTRRELSEVFGLDQIIGKSQPMQKVFKILEKITQTDTTILILGESGTGKELVAKFIHYNSRRSDLPMISINCSAFNDTLLESELFGHRKGAFTGATESKMGLFQLADHGALFLDEVGDMSPEMQKKLLRVLQDGEVKPVGSNDIYRTDVRIIAATNRNLKELVQQGKFREDLYFRLNVIRIEIPPLRQRREDIPLLIDFFTNRISKDLNRAVKGIPASVLKSFLDYDWPGNVRELENELRRYFILESEYEFEPAMPYALDKKDLKLESIERNAIIRALEVSAGNKSRAAELLGMSRRTFYDKLEKYSIS